MLDKWRKLIPEPIFDKDPNYVDLYWAAWKMAARRVKYLEDLPQSPYMDEACWDTHIWIWDTAFMALFTKYSPKYFPGVESFKNFYLPMHDGSGKLPLAIQHPDNPPLFAWCEYNSWIFNKATSFGKGKDALRTSIEYLIKHYEWFDHVEKGTRFGGAKTVLQHVSDKQGVTKGYLWNGVASGMDNTPRARTFGTENTLWVDAIAQQGLSALYIARLAEILGELKIADEYNQEYHKIKHTVNTLYWNNNEGAYYDIHKDSTPGAVRYSGILTPASFWPLLGEMASPEQAQSMIMLLNNKRKLGGTVPFVTLSRDDQDFNTETGDYWRGAIWMPNSYMGIKALETYSYNEEADVIAEKTIKHMLHTYQNPTAHKLNNGKPTIWECYSPDIPLPSTEHGRTARPEFCGWSALGPISLFIENVLGFHKIMAKEKRVEWRLHQTSRHGIKNLRFGDIVTDIIYDEQDIVTVRSNASYTLIINDIANSISKGTTTIKLKA